MVQMGALGILRHKALGDRAILLVSQHGVYSFYDKGLFLQYLTLHGTKCLSRTSHVSFYIHMNMNHTERLYMITLHFGV